MGKVIKQKHKPSQRTELRRWTRSWNAAIETATRLGKLTKQKNQPNYIVVSPNIARAIEKWVK